MERRDVIAGLGATLVGGVIPAVHANEKGKNPTPQHVDEPIAPAKKSASAATINVNYQETPPALTTGQERSGLACRRAAKDGIWIDGCGVPVPQDIDGASVKPTTNAFNHTNKPNKAVQTPTPAAPKQKMAPMEPDDCSGLTQMQQKKSAVCAPLMPPPQPRRN